ncbi:MAG: pseudouridine synthase [Crocinitomicaceae bacterium]|nr:pseudouridine synthase [Crocinitomicaceae bacterium]
MSLDQKCFTYFKESVDSIALPERFTFPFYYSPHPLCEIAAKELQEHLRTQSDWDHNFGLDSEQKGTAIGKMFGVLVVENDSGELGYLSAFSGKMANGNHHAGFVPPVYDMLTDEGFFKQGTAKIDELTNQIDIEENDTDYLERQEQLAVTKTTASEEIETERESMRQAKKVRKEKRISGKETLSDSDYSILEKDLTRESLHRKHVLRELMIQWEKTIEEALSAKNHFSNHIKDLKLKRKSMSAQLQAKIFDQYHFLNQNGERRNVLDMFIHTPNKVPPSGAGECAAPKLLQYAFMNSLRPVAMAEFWWGESPKSEIRKHEHFYPACRGKCEPILAHMLDGIELDPNPMLINPAEGKELEIVFEDDHLVVVNKPEEFLSVPGKTISDSVYSRMKERYPDATGPLIVHRLDMSTSGLLLIAKTKEANKALQSQFIERTVKKRYTALLEGIVKTDTGMIDLPLRLDIDDRPRQLVCYDHGKPAKTKWKVVERKEGKTRIHFYPITGRTHQLRVHAAHQDGLNAPIIGDDLYGSKSSRLYLHAESISFQHPVTKKPMTIKCPAKF